MLGFTGGESGVVKNEVLFYFGDFNFWFWCKANDFATCQISIWRILLLALR